MKRQHPTDPNLFWCPKCKTYKARDEFWKRSNRPSLIQAECKDCLKKYYQEHPDAQRARGLRYSRKHPEKIKKWYENHRDRMLAIGKKRRDENPHEYDEQKKEYNDRARRELLDTYIKKTLKQNKEITVTPEMIELKRQQIIAKRTLKQFQNWRKENENESNHTDVHGKQFTDEENHEGRV
jgi:hypothetical protein